jgi:hypothetical protein
MNSIVVTCIAKIGSMDEGPAGSTRGRAALIGPTHVVGAVSGRLVAWALVGAGQRRWLGWLERHALCW